LFSAPISILTKSIGRIFYRNAINLGIPLVICKGIAAITSRGDMLDIDTTTGKIVNETTGATALAEPLSEYTRTLCANGGVKPLIRKQLEGKA
jgi:3-isopropylmalate/(R)-2-methylmalate dehydratase small subunit